MRENAVGYNYPYATTIFPSIKMGKIGNAMFYSPPPLSPFQIAGCDHHTLIESKRRE